MGLLLNGLQSHCGDTKILEVVVMVAHLGNGTNATKLYTYKYLN